MLTTKPKNISFPIPTLTSELAMLLSSEVNFDIFVNLRDQNLSIAIQLNAID
ncbi:hypothetical protein NIES21_09350 [Anabaenopsis circularis NIES-21]|uniref:Uncharacterized protein n=1 Tax=Anabaenopsis circularis NIES-21 TaxID=1085406 RepID=A0A1Z4GC81_9CYAN|nr:hypothetical protein NIES21_09350 [Anabaenopsis circularis NIES-21]